MPKPKKLTWNQRHPDKVRAMSKKWKARNPDWWRGRKMVQLLTSALVRGNDKSKVFTDAGMTMDQWIEHSPALVNGGLGLLMDGSKLVPIKGWAEFDLKLPSQLRAFLMPTNFKLVSK